MTQESGGDHQEVQAAYESAQKEGGLVSRINESSLQPAEKGTLLALFEQAGRAIYEDRQPSFADQLVNPPVTLHNPSLLHNSYIFLNLAVAAMQELTLQYKDPQLKGHVEGFYKSIQENIQGYLPKDVFDKDLSREITHLLEDFYEWHIRPTLSAARQLASSKADHVNSSFKDDLKSVREHMHHIHQALVSGNPYKSIVEHAPKVLEAISTAYIDRAYPEGSLERPFLVNLYAGAYLLNSIAKKGIEIESKTPKAEIPRHEQRYCYDPIAPQQEN